MALFSNIRSSGTADTFGLGNTENTNPALSEVNESLVLITASNRLGRFRNHVVWKLNHLYALARERNSFGTFTWNILKSLCFYRPSNSSRITEKETGKFYHSGILWFYSHSKLGIV